MEAEPLKVEAIIIQQTLGTETTGIRREKNSLLSTLK